MNTRTPTYSLLKLILIKTKLFLFFVLFLLFPILINAQNTNKDYAVNNNKSFKISKNVSSFTDNIENRNITNAAITVNKATKFQFIDGFGFFGAQDVWWSGSTLISDPWADLLISDLGVTIWRNELYPPADAYSDQDADWIKQKPVVLGIKSKALQYGVPLKYVFTVWSPPSALKCNIDTAENRQPGIPHPFGTKQGGALDPTKYIHYSDWLKAGIQQYADEGINIFGFSPQNEPL